MKVIPILSKIRDRITGSKEGTIFIPSYVKDIAERNTIKMALSSLLYEDENIWLTQKIMEKSYDVETHTINCHNYFDEKRKKRKK